MRMHLALFAVMLTCAVADTAAQERKSFDVVSIRPNTSDGSPSSSQTTETGGYNGSNVTLRTLMSEAFELPPDRIVDAPDWIDSLRFDVVARPAAPVPEREIAAMLQSMLVERFSLAAEVGTREREVYFLRTLRADKRLGPSVKPADETCAASGGKGCGLSVTRGNAGGRIQAGSRTFAQLADRLVGIVERPVVDETGVTQPLSFELKWRSELSVDPGSSPSPSIFTAVREQLGLKLEAARAPVTVVIVKRVSRPSKN